MNHRNLGSTNASISEVGFGAWAIGGAWGSVNDAEAMDALRAAANAGVTFFDTADVYGDGHSEQLIADFIAERPSDSIFVATKAGRRLDPHTDAGYNAENLASFIDRSRTNLRMDTLDLVQLHCPPIDSYYRPELFEVMDGFVTAGKIKAYGVSVEKVESALKAIEYPNVASVQIIYNMFRQRPADHFFERAQETNTGVIVRVPLASGLLSGKMTASTQFEADDHRNFNRNGEAFDVGETFAGVPYDLGLKAVEVIRTLVPEGVSMAQLALRWILMHPGVTTVIPGARNVQQATDNANANASLLAPLSDTDMEVVDALYEQHIKPKVHHRW